MEVICFKEFYNLIVNAEQRYGEKIQFYKIETDYLVFYGSLEY